MPRLHMTVKRLAACLPGLLAVLISTGPGLRGVEAAELHASAARALPTPLSATGEGTLQCEWRPGFFLDDLDGEVLAMVVWDDGSGPALYVGGNFLFASGLRVNHIAKWDGTAWSALGGPSTPGTIGVVRALAVWDDGGGSALAVGGDFTKAGGVTVNHVAKWNGTAWSALAGPSGTGVSGAVRALAAWDDGGGEALYAGGDFSKAGGVTVNLIAKWNGSAWSALAGPLDTGMDQPVEALTVWDDGGGPALYAGGYFTMAGGLRVNRIAKWNGTAWSPLAGPTATGMGHAVLAMTVWDDGGGPALYAGGYFTTAGGLTANRVAKWNGTEWSVLAGPAGTGTDSVVYALAAGSVGGGSALYAGGHFTTAGGVTVNYVAKWDGAAWSTLDGPAATGTDQRVWALAVWDDGGGPALYAGGDFTTAGGVEVHGVATWDGTAWSRVTGSTGAGLLGQVLALEVWDDGGGPALYAGGDFATAGGVTVNGIAKWNGTAWSPLSGPAGTGTNGAVRALAVWDDGGGPALYAGGDFTTAGGVTVNYVAKWDGTTWSTLSGPSAVGASDPVLALAVWDDGGGEALYAGGTLIKAGGVLVAHVAKWDGTAWSALSGPAGTGVNGAVHVLTAWDDGGGPALFAGGEFILAGGEMVNHVARWNGTGWSALSGSADSGVDDTVFALAGWDDGGGPALYAGGSFLTAGGATADRIAKWNGSEWSALPGTSLAGVNDEVDALTVWDDGDGSALYAGGTFTTADALTVNRVVKWDGTAWSDLAGPSGTGLDGPTQALAVWDDGDGQGLHAGGTFSTAGGLASDRIAKYFCAPPDTTAPTDPSTLVSTDHAEAGWSTDTTIDMTWSGATDETGGSGVDHYRVLFDPLPTTVPDDTTTVPHTTDPHSISSPILADGQWYFHLATCDVAGNCSAGLHRGPYGIDTTPPSAPTGLDSSSHQVGVPSGDATIDVEWLASVDTPSGVAGYAWTFDQSDTWSCDGTIDGAGLSATSSPLATGPWWFHLCSVDEAGNTSAVSSLGPFALDLTAPSILALDTVADTGDGMLDDGEQTSVSLTQILVSFDEDLDPAAAEDLGNWLLAGAGSNGTVDTSSCAIDPDDVDFGPTAATLLADRRTVRLDVGGGVALPTGRFRLWACEGITDAVGNALAATSVDFGVRVTNVVPNPNFDDGIAPWVAGGSRPQDLGWSAADAEGKATSGSMAVTAAGATGETTIATTCIEVVPGTPIVLGGAIEVEGGAGGDLVVSGELRGSVQPGCSALGQPTSAPIAAGPTAGWVPFVVSLAGDYASVEVRLVVANATSAAHTVRFDLLQLFGPIFADGFESGDTSAWTSTVP